MRVPVLGKSQSRGPIGPSRIPPEGYGKGSCHWGKVDSGVRRIGEEDGVFVNFGGEEMNVYTGVLRWAQIHNLCRGDKIYCAIKRPYYNPGKDRWQFELQLSTDKTIRFPVIRQDHIVISKDITEGEYDGVVHIDFERFVQPEGGALEYCDPPAIVSIQGQKYELLAPEGFLELFEAVVSGEPFEMVVIRTRRWDDFHNISDLALPKFPGIRLGTVERKIYSKPQINDGDTIKCCSTTKGDNRAWLFETILRGGLGFDYLPPPEPTLGDLAQKAGAPAGLAEAIHKMQHHSRMDLLILKQNVVKDDPNFPPAKDRWPLAHPDFPAWEIGFAEFQEWFGLGEGDTATFMPYNFKPENILKHEQYFELVPSRYEANKSYQVKVMGPDMWEKGDKYVKANRKGYECLNIPPCFLPEAKPGDEVIVEILGRGMALPEPALWAAARLQTLLTKENTWTTATVTSEFCHEAEKEHDPRWKNTGYHIELSIENYKIKAFLVTGQDTGLKIGEAIIVKPAKELMGKFESMYSILEYIGNLRFFPFKAVFDFQE